MRAPEVGGGARSRRRLQLHHGFTANKTGVPASGGLSTLVPGALGPQRSRRSSRRPVPAGRSRPPEAANSPSAPPENRRSQLPEHRPHRRLSQKVLVYTLSLSGSSYELLDGLPGNLQHQVGRSRILEPRVGPAANRSLLLCWKKCACLGPSRRRSPRRPALSIARANCSMTLVGGTDSRCERRRSCQCASTTKW